MVSPNPYSIQPRSRSKPTVHPKLGRFHTRRLHKPRAHPPNLKPIQIGEFIFTKPWVNPAPQPLKPIAQIYIAKSVKMIETRVKQRAPSRSPRKIDSKWPSAIFCGSWVWVGFEVQSPIPEDSMAQSLSNPQTPIPKLNPQSPNFNPQSSIFNLLQSLQSLGLRD